MEKNDFRKGQTVWVYLVGNAARDKKTLEERIQEWEVVSVGRKYVKCKNKYCNWLEAKFDIEKNFSHIYKYGTADYVLYLSKEDILNEIRKEQVIEKITNMFKWENKNMVRKISIGDLEIINNILDKYI